MDKFDKNIYDKLNQIDETDFDFKPAAWGRLQEQRAEETEAKKSGFYPWLKRNSAAAAIILLLLISNIFFAHQSITTQYEIEKISNKFEVLTTGFEKVQLQNKVEEANYLTAIETLSNNLNINNEVISTLKKDNQLITSLLKNQQLKINKKEDKRNNFNNSSTDNWQQNNQSSFLGNEFLSTDYQSIKSSNSTELSRENRLNRNGIIDKIINNEYSNPPKIISNTNTIATVEKEDFLNNKFDFLETSLLSLMLKKDTINLNLEAAPEGTNPHRIITFRDKLAVFSEKVSPTNHQLGLNFQAGFIPIENNLETVVDIQTGLNVSTVFFDRIRLNTGVNIWTQSYNYDNLSTLSDEIITNITANLPTPTPTNVQDDLNSIEGQINGLTFPLKAQVLLGNPSSKWTPYVGFGVVGRYFRSADFEYYFLDNNSNNDTYEIKYPESIKQFDFNLFTSSIGMNYQISRRFALDVAFNFSKSNKVQPIGITNLEQFGGQLNLKYNF